MSKFNEVYNALMQEALGSNLNELIKELFETIKDYPEGDVRIKGGGIFRDAYEFAYETLEDELSLSKNEDAAVTKAIKNYDSKTLFNILKDKKSEQVLDSIIDDLGDPDTDDY